MIEKNIVGTYNISDEYPVFKYGQGKSPPAIPTVSAPIALSSTAAIQGSVSGLDPIAQWRSFSERLRERRLAKEAQAEGFKTEFVKTAREKKPSQEQIARKFQTRYETDMVNISNQAIDPMYHSLQRYLSIVNNPVPDENMKAYEATNEEQDFISEGELRVGDVMTKRVICVIESTPIEEFASICNRRGITGVPVVHYNTRNLLGIVSVSDIIRQIFDRKAISTFDSISGEVLEQQALAVLDQPVREFMIKEVITVTPETSVKEACRLMMEHKIRRVVVTRGDLVNGIFSARDAIKVLAQADLSLQNT